MTTLVGSSQTRVLANSAIVFCRIVRRFCRFGLAILQNRVGDSVDSLITYSDSVDCCSTCSRPHGNVPMGDSEKAEHRRLFDEQFAAKLATLHSNNVLIARWSRDHIVKVLQLAVKDKAQLTEEDKAELAEAGTRRYAWAKTYEVLQAGGNAGRMCLRTVRRRRSESHVFTSRCATGHQPGDESALGRESVSAHSIIDSTESITHHIPYFEPETIL